MSNIDEIDYENLMHKLDILIDVISVIKNDEVILSLVSIIDDYERLEQDIKDNRQNMMEIEILSVNGVLEASRMQGSDNVVQIFKDLKYKIEHMQDNLGDTAKSLIPKKSVINATKNQLHRFDDTIEFIEKLKESAKGASRENL